MSIQNKHTPGPWHRCCNSDYSIQICSIDPKTDAPNALIVEVLKRAWCNAEQEQANAKLIALAPEMYEALRDLLAPLTKSEIDEFWQYKQAADILAKLEKE